MDEGLHFNGERILFGASSKRMEDDHVERYRYSARYCYGKRVLDIACGTGYGSHMISAAGAEEVLGLDISKEAVHFAKNNYSNKNLNFLYGDIQCELDINFTPDLITCFETIEHVNDWKSAIKSLAKVTNGRACTLLMSSPNRKISSPSAIRLEDTPRNKFHVREFLIHELVEELQSSGFKVVDVFGQRHQPYFHNAIIQKIFQRLFKPHILSSPKLTKSILLEPTYFMVVATIGV